ncbi:MAG: GDSL-type esterase/lipase family protein [Cyclonatronaceae bacterium]
MIQYILMYCLSVCLLLISCSRPSDAPIEPSIEESLIQIVQIADTLKGIEGQIMEFHILNYFYSEAPIVNSEFSSEDDQIAITSLGDGLFEIHQTEELSGLFRIQAFITNSDNATLESELMYQIGNHSEPASSSGEVLVIMPLGDSMTNDSRSRVKLWNLLSDDGHNLKFVGDQYQKSSIPDANHEGVGGMKIEDIMNKTATLMQTHRPQYVALMVGTNDIAWYFNETASDIAARWGALVDHIVNSSEPGTYILAATIPPVSSKNVGNSGMSVKDRAVMVQLYNDKLRSIIKDRKANGMHIILADMEAALDPSKHLSNDGVHLNEIGYAIMGTVYYDAMNKALKEDQ